jgi:hypothetical protein
MPPNTPPVVVKKIVFPIRGESPELENHTAHLLLRCGQTFLATIPPINKAARLDEY